MSLAKKRVKTKKTVKQNRQKQKTPKTKKTLSETNSVKTEKPKEITIAVAGNPNVGKSTVFNALTGLHQHTGNWPGKTVECAKGSYIYKGQKLNLIDIPGTYSLITSSPEEEIAKECICCNSVDAVIVVVDATCLERNLNLALQILEITKKVVICVNLIDEAEKKNIQIDIDELSLQLGVPVVGTNARKKHNLNLLIKAASEVANETQKTFRKKTDHSEDLNKILNGKECNQPTEKIMQKVFAYSEEICRRSVEIKNKKYDQRDRKIDNLLTSKKTGIPIMILLLLIVFWITLAGANYPSELIANGLFSLQEKLLIFFKNISTPNWVSGILIEGIYRTLAWVVSVMLPPMAIFFPLFTFLEDIGYLPRIAFNLDSVFKKAGAHGKQALTTCMGFGCNACGVIGCRIIDSPRERLIAILTNNFVPCNGRFPLLITLIGIFFLSGSLSPFLLSLGSALLLTGIILLGILVTFLVSKILSKTVLKGVPSSFVLELPPYRKPQIGKILIRSVFDRTLFVLARAVVVAIPAGLVIWIMANTQIHNISILAHFSRFLDPFARFIGLDGVILMAFILGLPANEIVLPIIIMSYMCQGSILELESASELYNLLASNGWTFVTAICTVLFALMHFPCGTTLLTIKKETGSLKWTALSFLIPTIMGIITCGIVANLFKIFGVD